MQTPAIHPDRVAIYVRWSTEEQGEGTTAQVQLETCRAYLVSQGWRPNPTLTFIDDGYSGGSLDRPGIQELRRLCSGGLVDCVVVFKLDRLSRSVLDTVNLVLNEWADKVYLKSAREPIDTSTAMGKQFFYLLISYAEWERNVIRERTMSGRLKRAQEGRHLTRPPYGYATGETPGQRVVVPEEAEVVRQMFARYVAGVGDRQIATWLNKQGVRSQSGKFWHPNTVKNLLTNPFYAGTLRYGHKAPGSLPGQSGESGPFLVETESATPAIVSRDVFETALRIRNGEADRVTSRAPSSPHLLVGLLRCRCGAPVQYKHIKNQAGRRFGYYLCAKKFALGALGCTTGFLPVDAVESAVVGQFLERFCDPQIPSAALDEILHGAVASRMADAEAQLKRLRQEQERLQRGLDRLDADYLAGELPAKRYDSLRAKAEESLSRVVAEIDQVMVEAGKLSVPMQQQALVSQIQHRDQWTMLTATERKELLSIFLASVVVYRPLRSGTWDCEMRWRTGHTSQGKEADDGLHATRRDRREPEEPGASAPGDGRANHGRCLRGVD